MKNGFGSKIIVLLLFSISVSGQAQKGGFTLNGVIRGNYKGYLYLHYENLKDSCLIIDHKFCFKGKVSKVDVGYFSIKRAAGMDKDFYLENKNINIDITLEKKTVRDTELDWITINSVKGTKTALIEEDYEGFRTQHQNDNDWQIKHYGKLDEIVSKYPAHPYALDLLVRASWDSLANNQKLQHIYKKLELKSQHPESLLILKKNIFPVESSKVGKVMMDFELPNEKGILINTKQYRGSVLLVDFWASWCAPCRKQIPEIAKVFEKRKNKNFKILSISLDNDKNKWLSALEKEKMQWDNVLEIKEFSSYIAKEYEITAIPATFLIDSNGIIIANNPTIQELENYLIDK